MCNIASTSQTSTPLNTFSLTDSEVATTAERADSETTAVINASTTAFSAPTTEGETVEIQKKCLDENVTFLIKQLSDS